MTFFGKGKVNLLGSDGVSKAFMLGMAHIKKPLPEARAEIQDFIDRIAADPFFNSMPSIKKRIDKGPMFLHAKDDPPELRLKFYELLLAEIPFTLQVVVGRKDIGRFIRKHKSNDKEFYVELLAHLLSDKGSHSKLVLDIANLGNVTRMKTLEAALTKATASHNVARPGVSYKANIVFNPQPYSREPLLAVADYALWAVQRVFETGQTRYYNLVSKKIRFITDLYAFDPADPAANSYTPRKPLTEENKLT